MDSLAHLSTSLAELADILKKSQHGYPYLKQSKLCCDASGSFSEDRLALLMVKSVFPYDRVKNDLTYLSRRDFPAFEDFYSVLSESNPVSREDYDAAKRVYRELGLQTVKDFLLAYNTLDVFLLAEACEQYEATMFANFNLYPLRFLSMPSFSLSSFLKMTGVKIELLQQPTEYKMIESSLRGENLFFFFG